MKQYRPYRAAVMLAVLAALLLSALPAFAQDCDAAYCLSSAPLSSDSFLSLGFVFTPNREITVTSLGYFDHEGFASNHIVGIFDADGRLLVSTRLDADFDGTLGIPFGGFRYNEIEPTTLAAGRTYTIAATTGGFADKWAYGNRGSTLVDFVVNPAITIADNASRYHYQGEADRDVLRLPTGSISYTIYAGPNFQFE